MSIEVQETQFDLDSVLTRLGYPSDKISEIKNSDVLLLPTDLDSPESHFPDKSVSLKKTIEKQLRINVIYKQGSKTHYKAHRAAEIILPLLVFLGWQVLDICKNIIADWLVDELSRFGASRKPNAKVRLIVVDSKKKTSKELTCEGPAESLVKILRQFKVDE